ncbi:hypothetical protein GLYMA_19G250300v4 [Glycine max]|uniref:Uncharacterized protein n=2 Tax=Glycine subgen. Soja TaxID=1462606 RepID=A0A0R0F4H3_SOYBN|nr:hypothetical protein GYH30_054166 [Glycine max]KRG97076.1 hypothetical protein GLYMA_19G250300v4 [Glycine max]RZB49644.1 hypothetical protein D0Y65_052527 [Glycine soja]
MIALLLHYRHLLLFPFCFNNFFYLTTKTNTYIQTSSFFNQGTCNVEEVLELIKYKSWSWLREKIKGFEVSLFDWTMDPFLFLSYIM